MYYQIKQVQILLKRGHTKMLIFDISGPWVLAYYCSDPEGRMHLYIKGSAYCYIKDNHLANMAWWLKSADALNFEL